MKRVIIFLLSVVGLFILYDYNCREDSYYDNIEDIFDTLEGYDFY